MSEGLPNERAQTLRREVDEVGFWWHSIDLGDGVVTPGVKTPGWHANEIELLALPPMDGRTVLDIGTWDGFYAFHAERRGASRVVALDHFVWSLHLNLYTSRPSDPRRGRLEEDPQLWDPDGLPGRAGFDLAHRSLNSKVEPVVADFAHDDLKPLGRFDVVLFLGVVYHLTNPIGGLRKLYELTRDVAVIESEAVAIGGYPDASAVEFMGTRKHADDSTNFWAPTRAALDGMCRVAGFSRVDHVGLAPPAPPPGEMQPYRAMCHVWR
jgi:tRNA (mo5U34)-methyltransferase